MNIIIKGLSTLRGRVVSSLSLVSWEKEQEKQSIPEVEQQKCAIVCWGDSMTEGVGASKAIIKTDNTYFDASGLSYPEVLEQLTGIRTYNYGVSGATSDEIVALQGQKRASADDILILEIGSNGGWKGNYDNLIQQYKTMIEYAGCSRYIIIGDTDDPMNSVDKAVVRKAKKERRNLKDIKKEHGLLESTYWEKALQEAFGEHFINMRLFLIENGLRIAGLEVSPKDIKQHRQGNISKQLRTDWTHFNSYGYYAKAVGVYQKGKELGYFLT